MNVERMSMWMKGVHPLGASQNIIETFNYVIDRFLWSLEIYSTEMLRSISLIEEFFSP